MASPNLYVANKRRSVTGRQKKKTIENSSIFQNMFQNDEEKS